MDGQADRQTYGWMERWTDRQIGVQRDGWTLRQTDTNKHSEDQASKMTDGQRARQTCQIDKQINRRKQPARWMDRETDRRENGQTDLQTDLLMGRQRDRWKDRRTDKQTNDRWREGQSDGGRTDRSWADR